MNMHVVFCSDPFNLSRPDPEYQAEVDSVVSLGGEYSLISYEALVDGNDPAKATSGVRAQPQQSLGAYRGWMLRPETYKRLYDVLLARNIRLINDPNAYKHCHYLPESYPVIDQYTPMSVWLRYTGSLSIGRIMEALRPFGSDPVVVKDYVKSRKHEWSEACYIPSASDRSAVERVVRRFLELQGEDLNEGLVFREFVQFEPLAVHSKSGMPLAKEFRIFFLDGQPVYAVEYWEEGDYRGTTAPVDQFVSVASRVGSRFFTMDVAKRAAGDWMIVELGDGQVAGLPEKASVLAFYQALKRAWPE